MPFGLNIVDFVIIATLIFFATDGFGRPLILELLDLVSFVTAFFLSFAYYNFFANIYENQFKISHGISLVLGFVTVWFLSELIAFLIVRLVLTRWPIIRIYGEKYISVIPALLRGLLLVCLFLVLMGTFPIQPLVKKNIQESRIGSFLLENSYQLEQPVKNVFGSVSNDTLTFLTTEPKDNESINLGFKTNNFKPAPDLERQMITLVNMERTKRGLKALTYDPQLQSIARVHSADMFERGYFSHYTPENKSVVDRANTAKIQYTIIGENIAYAPSLELAHQGLMNSPGHRANILSTDYHKVGIGIMDGGIYGEMFTQDFSN